jgi:hypothetical protein
LEEEFEGLETSNDELCLEESDAMAGKTWYIGPSCITEVTLAEMCEDGWFRAGHAMPSPDGEATLNPPKGYAVVFKDFFSCGLRFPCTSFLGEVLEAFPCSVTSFDPQRFLTLSKFCWACESYGAALNIDILCAYFELQKQPKKVTVDGVELVAQYGSCTFMAKRFQGVNKLELSFCQNEKWDRGRMEDWFYVRTTGQTLTYDDGLEETIYPLASVMSEMSPLC